MRRNKQQQEAELTQRYNAIAEPDPLRGKGWCRYQLNGWHICERICDNSYIAWIMARVVDGHYTDHWRTKDSSVSSLETVFQRALS